MQNLKVHPNAKSCIQSYPTTCTCSDVTERSIGSPRMGGISVGVASTVVDNAKASLEKYTQNTFNCEINTKIQKCIQMPKCASRTIPPLAHAAV